nr:MAG TPA: hypothetical protein [Caudoviricetes sp.]
MIELCAFRKRFSWDIAKVHKKYFLYYFSILL